MGDVPATREGVLKISCKIFPVNSQMHETCDFYWGIRTAPLVPHHLTPGGCGWANVGRKANPDLSRGVVSIANRTFLKRLLFSTRDASNGQMPDALPQT